MTMFHPSLATVRHHELLAEREQDRRAVPLRRLAKARRLQQRADALNRRAAELAARTHG